MERDYFAEEIEGQDTTDYFSEEIEKKIPKTENVLSRAIRVGGQKLEEGVGFLQGKPAWGSQAEDMRQRGIEGLGIENPVGRFAVDVATDPTTYVGGGAAISKGAKSLFPFITKNARVGFTKGVEKSLVKRRGALTRGFGASLKKSKAKVDLSDIMEDGSEITEFTMKEAQDLKNAISMGIPDAVKSGVRIDPKHFGNREIAGMISERMKKADPQMARHIEKYGEHAENFKSAISPIKGGRGSENIFGSNLVSQMFRGGGIPEKSQVAMKAFAPKVAKKVSKAKISQNVFKGLRGTAIGATLYNLVPSALKRAFLSEVSK